MSILKRKWTILKRKHPKNDNSEKGNTLKGNPKVNILKKTIPKRTHLKKDNSEKENQIMTVPKRTHLKKHSSGKGQIYDPE